MMGSRMIGCASLTRAVKFGGYNPGHTNVMCFVNIATLGNSIVLVIWITWSGDVTRQTSQSNAWGYIMSEINASNFRKEHDDLAPDIVGVSELTSPCSLSHHQELQRKTKTVGTLLNLTLMLRSLEVFREIQSVEQVKEERSVSR